MSNRRHEAIEILKANGFSVQEASAICGIPDLRDQFAMAALASIAHHGSSYTTNIAEDAYRIADSMIDERSVRDQ